jgi:hypothetical protein
VRTIILSNGKDRQGAFGWVTATRAGARPLSVWRLDRAIWLLLAQQASDNGAFTSLPDEPVAEIVQCGERPPKSLPANDLRKRLG